MLYRKITEIIENELKTNNESILAVEPDITSPIELIATFKEVEEENNEDIPSLLYNRKDYRPLEHMSI